MITTKSLNRPSPYNTDTRTGAIPQMIDRMSNNRQKLQLVRGLQRWLETENTRLQAAIYAEELTALNLRTRKPLK